MKTGCLLPGRLIGLPILFLSLLLYFGYTPSSVYASEHNQKSNKEDAEESKESFNLIISYTDVTVGPGQDFEMDAEVVNRRKDPVHVFLETQSVPEGWEVGFHSRYPSFPIRAVMVQGKKSTTLEFKAKLPDKIEPGDYEVMIVAKDKAGTTTQKDKVIFRVSSEKVETGGLKMESQYPVLSGASNQTFKFSIELENETDEALTTVLSAQAPPGWRVAIKPQFEDTQISSIALKKDSTETLSVEINPPVTAKAGDYPITIKARSGSFQTENKLKITLTGTYDLQVGTPPPGNLNTSITAGEKAQVVFLIGNAGTAALRNLSFLSTKPEKWNVKFEPEKIDSLEVGEVREVKTEILAPKRTIAGDYLLVVTSNSPDVNKSIEYRVTVSTPTVWGWIGFVIVILVVLGLGGVFMRLGRR
ncbi:MAG: NEW3 domain-containing protein [Candidatus Binatia bacterium]